LSHPSPPRKTAVELGPKNHPRERWEVIEVLYIKLKSSKHKPTASSKHP
jgi:hypothetical protein